MPKEKKDKHKQQTKELTDTNFEFHMNNQEYLLNPGVSTTDIDNCIL